MGPAGAGEKISTLLVARRWNLYYLASFYETNIFGRHPNGDRFEIFIGGIGSSDSSGLRAVSGTQGIAVKKLEALNF